MTNLRSTSAKDKSVVSRAKKGHSEQTSRVRPVRSIIAFAILSLLFWLRDGVDNCAKRLLDFLSIVLRLVHRVSCSIDPSLGQLWGSEIQLQSQFWVRDPFPLPARHAQSTSAFRDSQNIVNAAFEPSFSEVVNFATPSSSSGVLRHEHMLEPCGLEPADDNLGSNNLAAQFGAIPNSEFSNFHGDLSLMMQVAAETLSVSDLHQPDAKFDFSLPSDYDAVREDLAHSSTESTASIAAGKNEADNEANTNVFISANDEMAPPADQNPPPAESAPSAGLAFAEPTFSEPTYAKPFQPTSFFSSPGGGVAGRAAPLRAKKRRMASLNELEGNDNDGENQEAPVNWKGHGPLSTSTKGSYATPIVGNPFEASAALAASTPAVNEATVTPAVTDEAHRSPSPKSGAPTGGSKGTADGIFHERSISSGDISNLTAELEAGLYETGITTDEVPHEKGSNISSIQPDSAGREESQSTVGRTSLGEALDIKLGNAYHPTRPSSSVDASVEQPLFTTRAHTFESKPALMDCEGKATQPKVSPAIFTAENPLRRIPTLERIEPGTPGGHRAKFKNVFKRNSLPTASK